jgi:hypothetical protein
LIANRHNQTVGFSPRSMGKRKILQIMKETPNRSAGFSRQIMKETPNSRGLQPADLKAIDT